MRPQPLIAVTDVEASTRWYQRLLGCRSAHGGPEYERLVSDGGLVLQLHAAFVSAWCRRARTARRGGGWFAGEDAWCLSAFASAGAT